MWHIHIMENYLALKRREILQYPIAWTDLEDITLNEISHTKKDKCCDSTYMRYLE